MSKPFNAGQFTATEFNSAEDKAWFANHFVRFVESGFRKTLFTKRFYIRLSMTFGHIAHYDKAGFWQVYFVDVLDRVSFIRSTLRAGCHGSPNYTYCDVERVIVDWMIDDGTLARYERQLDGDKMARERAEYNRLRAIYG